MAKQDFIVTDTEQSVKSDDKQEYAKPRLIKYGDVRDITLGVSGIGFESGGGGVRCDPPFCP